MRNKPAFPESSCREIDPGWIGGGMTLRDYFAAKAMQGLLAQSLGTALGSDPESGAIYAYKMSDAMIAERDKRETK